VTEATGNQLKGMMLAIVDTVVIAAGLAAWTHHQRHGGVDAGTIASAGVTLALPFGAILGRIATDPHQRQAWILGVAFVMVVVCALVAWGTLSPAGGGFELAVLTAAMWAPTSILALVLERWTRPAPPIPTCEVHKTLL
jgi:hypothetical protein